MTLYQYSQLQRLLGRLEGIGEGIPANIRPEYDGTLADLDTIIEEMRKGEKWSWEKSNR